MKIRRWIWPLALIALAGCSTTYRTYPRTFPAETLNEIEQNPNRYLDDLYAFQGRVIRGAQEDEAGRLVFQMIVKDDEGNIAEPLLTVYYRGTDFPVARDHHIKVLGRMSYAMPAMNEFGIEVVSVSMNAIAVWDMTAGRVGWLRESEETYRAWKSGELFAPE